MGRPDLYSSDIQISGMSTTEQQSVRVVAVAHPLLCAVAGSNQQVTLTHVITPDFFACTSAALISCCWPAALTYSGIAQTPCCSTFNDRWHPFGSLSRDHFAPGIQADIGRRIITTDLPLMFITLGPGCLQPVTLLKSSTTSVLCCGTPSHLHSQQQRQVPVQARGKHLLGELVMHFTVKCVMPAVLVPLCRTALHEGPLLMRPCITCGKLGPHTCLQLPSSNSWLINTAILFEQPGKWQA